LHMLRVFVGQLNARFLSPEQVGHNTDESRLGEFVRVMAHRVVDAPDLHDGDDRASRGPVRYRQIRPHRAVAQLELDILRLHLSNLECSAVASGKFSSRRAFSAKMPARSAVPISSASMARIVPRMSARPPSGSNGASVANRHFAVPKNACPQRVAASTPLSAVSA